MLILSFFFFFFQNKGAIFFYSSQIFRLRGGGDRTHETVNVMINGHKRNYEGYNGKQAEQQ